MFRVALVAFVLATAGCAGVPAEPRSRTSCTPTVEASRDLVLSFYRLALIDKQPRAAFGKYVSPDFVEHKPDVPTGGRDAVVDFLEGLLKDLPDARWEILRTVAEEDHVFLHARFTPAPGAPAYAIADLFRIQDCSIVEHWDVVGPPREGQPNTNSRF